MSDSKKQNIKIHNITRDRQLQQRHSMSEDHVRDLKALIKDKGTDALTPPKVFFDGNTYWLADGHHTVEAATQCGYRTIVCEVFKGTKRDAFTMSLGVNAEHGLKRSLKDRRRAVNSCLDDPEYSDWTHAQIAELCKVDRQLVRRMREERMEQARQQPVDDDGFPVEPATSDSENSVQPPPPSANQQDNTIGLREEAVFVFGARLREIRETLGLSDEDLAKLSGVNRAVINCYERGDREPSWSRVVVLSNCLGVTPNDFIRKAEAKGESQ